MVPFRWHELRCFTRFFPGGSSKCNGVQPKLLNTLARVIHTMYIFIFLYAKSQLFIEMNHTLMKNKIAGSSNKWQMNVNYIINVYVIAIFLEVKSTGFGDDGKITISTYIALALADFFIHTHLFYNASWRNMRTTRPTCFIVWRTRWSLHHYHHQDGCLPVASQVIPGVMLGVMLGLKMILPI